MKYLLIRFFISILPSGVMRTKYIKKWNIFKEVGENFYFCPRKLPADPQFIKFHNNVAVAADVLFCNHDVMQKVFNHTFNVPVPKFFGCIEVMDNVFIGSKTMILPNVRIASNVIIAADSLVTKSITESGVYAGHPVKKVGEFSDLYKKRLDYKILVEEGEGATLEEILWNWFYKNNECT